MGKEALMTYHWVLSPIPIYVNTIHVAAKYSRHDAVEQIFERNPVELCTEIVVEDDSTQNRFHYRVQDTPGAPTFAQMMAHKL